MLNNEYIEHKINEDEDGNARSPLVIKHVKENIYKIRAQNYVGSLKIPNSHQIIIHPKVKLNFIQMLGHTLKIEDQDFIGISEIDIHWPSNVAPLPRSAKNIFFLCHG